MHSDSYLASLTETSSLKEIKVGRNMPYLRGCGSPSRVSFVDSYFCCRARGRWAKIIGVIFRFDLFTVGFLFALCMTSVCCVLSIVCIGPICVGQCFCAYGGPYLSFLVRR